MKKAAYAPILILAFLFSAEAQVVMVMANAYPYIPTPWGYPEINITSPVQNGTYLQNDVWLNLTVTKPSNWTNYEGQLKYVAYLIDGDHNSFKNSFYYGNCGETRVAVEDPLGVVNPPLKFNFSMKLAGLSEGTHHIDIEAAGLVKDGEFDMPVGSGVDTIYFSVTEESSAFPATLLIAAVLAAVVVGIGLPFYFKKRKR